jgi:class I fructose-bisphosphate aldolase
MTNFDYLSPFFKNGKTCILAYDHGFEHGILDFNERNIDPNYVIDLAVAINFSGVVLQKGVAEKYYSGTNYEKQIPLIIKLNGKTNLLKTNDPYASSNCSVSYAKELGAKAVGYTIYLGSKYEAQMFQEFGKIEEEAHRLNLGVIAWLYPARAQDLKNFQFNGYLGRLGLELGADLIKVKYSNFKAMKKLVQAAGQTKVVLSGGEKLSEKQFLLRLEEVLKAGCCGVTIGRNVWQRDDALEFANQIQKIIFS